MKSRGEKLRAFVAEVSLSWVFLTLIGLGVVLHLVKLDLSPSGLRQFVSGLRDAVLIAAFLVLTSDFYLKARIAKDVFLMAYGMSQPQEVRDEVNASIYRIPFYRESFDILMDLLKELDGEQAPEGYWWLRMRGTTGVRNVSTRDEPFTFITKVDCLVPGHCPVFTFYNVEIAGGENKTFGTRHLPMPPDFNNPINDKGDVQIREEVVIQGGGFGKFIVENRRLVRQDGRISIFFTHPTASPTITVNNYPDLLQWRESYYQPYEDKRVIEDATASARKKTIPRVFLPGQTLEIWWQPRASE